MRRSVGLGLLLLTACGGGIKAPETIPVPPVGFVPLTPVDTAPTEGTPASAAAAGTRDARTAPAWPLSLRVKAVTGEHAMVVTSHPLASDVGVDILRRGGNAVDAAVAIGFALAVVHPVAGNIGGGGFMVVRTRDGVVRTLDFREAAPSGATRSMYVDSAGRSEEHTSELQSRFDLVCRLLLEKKKKKKKQNIKKKKHSNKSIG